MKARRAPSKKLSIKAPLMARLDFFAEMVKANTFTRSALAVAFCLLYRHLNGSTCRCDPSIAVLAQETGLTTRSVKSAINELRERGWWRVSREGAKAVGGRTNAYAPLFEVVKHASPLSRESGEAQRHKVVKRASPGTSKEPVRRLFRSILSIQRADSRTNSVEQFERFWRSYPSRAPYPNPKKPARQKFHAVIRRGVDPDDIVRGVEAYSAAVQATGTDPRFVAQAVTWLNQERWTDHQAPAALPMPVAGMI
jgi:Helix-turn-helix domain